MAAMTIRRIRTFRWSRRTAGFAASSASAMLSNINWMRFSAKRTRCGNTSAALGDAAFDMRRTGASGPAPQELRQPETQRLEHPQRIGAPVGDQSLVSGDAKGAEERHVGLVERLAAEELPAPPLARISHRWVPPEGAGAGSLRRSGSIAGEGPHVRREDDQQGARWEGNVGGRGSRARLSAAGHKERSAGPAIGSGRGAGGRPD
jgi:hypothetical protein